VARTKPARKRLCATLRKCPRGTIDDHHALPRFALIFAGGKYHVIVPILRDASSIPGCNDAPGLLLYLTPQQQHSHVGHLLPHAFHDMKKLKTIHIGVGGRGLWPFRIPREDWQIEPVALVDTVDAALAAGLEATGLGETTCFRDAEEALRQVEADAVVICTPTLLHGRFCRLAFEHGRHVLVEKAMTNSWDDANDLVALAEKADVRFCVVQNLRYYPAYRFLHDLLQNPEHPSYPGDVLMMDFVQHRYRPDPRAQTYPLAMVWDMGVHHMDALVALKGPIERVEARAFSMPWSRYPHPTNLSARLWFADGSLCNYLLSHDGRLREVRVVLQGERGTVHFSELASSGPSWLNFYGVGARPHEAVSLELSENPSPSELLIRDFCDYVQGGPEPGISGRNNLETLGACEMLCRAAHEGREVSRSSLGDSSPENSVS